MLFIRQCIRFKNSLLKFSLIRLCVDRSNFITVDIYICRSVACINRTHKPNFRSCELNSCLFSRTAPHTCTFDKLISWLLCPSFCCKRSVINNLKTFRYSVRSFHSCCRFINADLTDHRYFVLGTFMRCYCNSKFAWFHRTSAAKAFRANRCSLVKLLPFAVRSLILNFELADSLSELNRLFNRYNIKCCFLFQIDQKRSFLRIIIYRPICIIFSVQYVLRRIG